MKNQKGFTLIELTIVIALLASAFGYVMNIIRLVSDWVGVDELSIIIVLRLIGIIAAPLGVIMGYIPG